MSSAWTWLLIATRVPSGEKTGVYTVRGVAPVEPLRGLTGGGTSITLLYRLLSRLSRGGRTDGDLSVDARNCASSLGDCCDCCDENLLTPSFLAVGDSSCGV